MNTPFISFIVPVLNAANYLKQCLVSLLQGDVEVIVIDDGSTDGSSDIIAELAAQDSRIKALKGQRQGAGAARNSGIEIAQGEYIIFVDADDWIQDNLYAKILEYRGYDIIYFGYNEVLPSKVIPCPINYSGDCSHIIDTTLARLFRSPERFFGFTWNKAFRRDIIVAHNIRFNPHLIIKEDEEFCLQFVNHIRSLYICGQPLYNYRIIANSLSHRKLADRKLTLLAETIEQTARACPWHQLKNEVLKAAFEYHLDGFRDSLGASYPQWKKYYKRNRDKLPKSLAVMLFTIPTDKARKFLLRLIYVNPYVARFKSIIRKL